MRISRVELLDDPQFYQEFFDKLSKAVSLEAHEAMFLAAHDVD